MTNKGYITNKDYIINYLKINDDVLRELILNGTIPIADKLKSNEPWCKMYYCGHHTIKDCNECFNRWLGEKYTTHINDVKLELSDFWIDVDKELPEENEEVLCYWWNGVIQPCKFEYDSNHKPMWCSPLTGTVGVLYWMPMPKAPRKEKD